MSSYYEKRILEVLEENNDGLTTVGVAEKADISKTTALKYLASLKAAGKIDYIEVGPSKLWRLTAPHNARSKKVLANRAREIKLVLKEFKEMAGLLGSVVVDNDGLTISADIPWKKNPEKIGSLISRLLQLGGRVVKAVKIDPVREIIIEGDGGRIVARNDGNVLLIAFSDRETPLGMVKFETEEFAKRIRGLLA